MKKTLHKLFLLFVICCVGLLPLFSYGQLSSFVLTAPAQPINTCGPAGSFSISMSPGASASTANTIMVTLPAGILYVDGSATINNGATISSVGGTATVPVFTIPNLASSSTTVLTFSATANCAYSSVAPFSANFTGTIGSNGPTSSSPINVQSAVFVATPGTNFSSFSGIVLQTYNRTATIQNTGTGFADTLLLLDTIGKGRMVNSLSLSNSIGITTVSKVAVNGGNDTAWAWKIYNFAGIGNSDVYFNPGENFTITQSLTIVGCTNLTDRFYVAPYCAGAGGCNSALLTGGATLPVTAQPSLTTVVPPYTGTYPIFPCTDGSAPFSSSVAVYNNSIGAAYNVQLRLGTDEGSGGLSTTIGNGWFTNLQLKINNGSYASITPDYTELITATAAFGDKCAVGKPGVVGITIPVLQPGDSIRLSYDMYHCTPTQICPPVIYSYTLYDGVGMNLSYTDQCRTGTITAPYRVLVNYMYAGESLTKGNNLVEIFPGSNNTISIGSGGTFDAAQFTAAGSFFYRVKMPSFLSMPTDPANVDLVMANGSIIVHPASITRISSAATDTTYDVLFNTAQLPSPYIGLLTAANLNLKNVVGVPCTGSGSISSPIEIQFYIRGINNACTPFLQKGCFKDSLVYRCPNPCPRGGISNSKFTLTRTNLGLPDNNNDGLPDGAALDFTKIRADKAVLGDTIAATATGRVVFGSQSNFTNGYFEPQMSKFSTASILQALDARISIYDGTGALRGTCSNLPLTTIVPNQVRANFSISAISACIPGYTQFVEGDSLAVTIRYKDNYKGGDGPILSATVPGYFYLSNIANPTAAADIYACDTSNTSFLLVPSYFTISPLNATSVGCDTIFASSYMLLSVAGYGNEQFPYEYRPLAVPGSFRISLPAGVRYAGRATLQIPRTPGSFDISSTATVYADSVVFNIRNMFADKGGPWALPEEGWAYIFNVRLLPDCISGQQTITLPFTPYYVGITDTVDFKQTYPWWLFETVTGPIVSITTSPQTQTVTGNTAVWELQVSNASSLAPSNNTWLAKGNGGTTTIQTLERLSGSGGTVVSTITPVNGIFQLGTLPTGSNQYYRATVSYANCVKDTLNIAYGYSCTGYPASLSAATCNFTATPLYIVPQPSLFQLSLLTQPVNPQTLCVDTTYILQLSNAQPGNAYSPTITAILPATNFAVTGNSSQVEYPAGIFTTISDPVLVNGKYQWGLSSVLPGGALPGNGTSLKLKFNAQATGCGFVSGDYPVFGAQGLSGCGQPVTVPTIAGNPFILGGDPLNTVNNFILTKEVTTTSLLACPGQSFTYTYSARNNGVGPSNASTEALEIEVPSWLTLVPGSFSTIKNPPANTNPNVVPLGSITSYRWNMPAGVVVGDTVKFSVQFAPGDALAVSCGSRFTIRNIVTNTFTTSATACLGGGSCSVRTIKGFDTVSIAVEKYNLQPTYLYVTPGVNENVIALKITNAGSRAYSGTMMYAVYADMNGDGVLDAGDVQVSPTLTSTQPLGANAVDTFSNVISLSGASLDPSVLGKQTLLVVKDSSCNCATTFKAAAPTSVALPVTLISFTGRRVGSNDLLNWVTSEEQNMEGYEVEYSTDAVHYTALGKVAATGNGSTQKQSYQYTHVGVSGNGWYRLRIRELDGSFRYSRVVKISGTENAGLCLVNTGIYPVPFVNELHIGLYSCTDKPATIQLYTAHGKKLLEQDHTLKAGSSYYTLSNLGRLPAGTYIVRVQTDSDVLIEKAVKY